MGPPTRKCRRVAGIVLLAVGCCCLLIHIHSGELHIHSGEFHIHSGELYIHSGEFPDSTDSRQATRQTHRHCAECECGGGGGGGQGYRRVGLGYRRAGQGYRRTGLVYRRAGLESTGASSIGLMFLQILQACCLGAPKRVLIEPSPMMIGLSTPMDIPVLAKTPGADPEFLKAVGAQGWILIWDGNGRFLT